MCVKAALEAKGEHLKKLLVQMTFQRNRQTVVTSAVVDRITGLKEFEPCATAK